MSTILSAAWDLGWWYRNLPSSDLCPRWGSATNRKRLGRSTVFHSTPPKPSRPNHNWQDQFPWGSLKCQKSGVGDCEFIDRLISRIWSEFVRAAVIVVVREFARELGKRNVGVGMETRAEPVRQTCVRFGTARLLRTWRHANFMCYRLPIAPVN